MILEVGSGGSLLIQKQLKGDVIHIDIDSKSKHLDVLCDANKLPFKDKSFNTVYCSHVLEHILNPLWVIKEFKRIARICVIIRIPSGNYYNKLSSLEDINHIYSWNFITFYRFLKVVFPSVNINNSVSIRYDSRNIKKYIVLVSTLFFGKNELVAICSGF